MVTTRKTKLKSLVITSIISTSAILLTSCATTKNYQNKLQSWHHQNINKFVSAWGYPDQTMKAPNGNTVYIYSSNQTTHFPEYQTGGYTTVQTQGDNTVITQVPSVQTGGGTYNYKCKTWVEFNKKDVIVNTSFRGKSGVA